MKELLNCVMDIGEQMLISGAEVHRVEDSVNRMCTALGAARVDCFIITSSMVVSLHDGEGQIHTETRRIRNAETNFHRLDLLNALSRRICKEKLSVEDMRKELAGIKQNATYPFFVECLAYATIAAVFTVFFGGGAVESMLAALIGLFVRFVSFATDKIVGNTMFTKFASAFTITAFAYLFTFLGAAASPDQIIIGNIMLIIPGLGFTNALRDLFVGDSIAGVLRLLEAVLTAIAIAAGYFVFVFLRGAVL